MIISFTGEKGGSGKSTACVSVAAELLRLGHHVVIIDADPQGSSETWRQAAVENGHDAPEVQRADATFIRRFETAPWATSLDSHVLIDTPGRLGAETRAALAISNLAIVVCRPTQVDLNALASTRRLLTGAAEALGREVPAVLLINQYPTRGEASAHTAEVLLRGESGFPVFDTVFHSLIDFCDCFAEGLGPSAMGKGKAAREVRALVSEILGMVGA